MEELRADESTLWRAALQHDSGAFAALFALYRDVVFRQALRLVDQPADAEEVAAAAFFELWRKRSSVRLVEGSVLPWLLVTATNLARNSHRALMRREALLQRVPRERDDEQSVRAFERIDNDVLRRDLAASLRRLKPQDVALVTMTALDGYALTEVAALVGLSEGAARVRLHRAYKKLRALLTAAGASQDQTGEVAT